MSAPATPRASKPATRLIVPAAVLALGVGGFFLLPDYLLYIGCTAMWFGLVGLAMYLPMAALQELPLNAAAFTGLAAYLFAFVAQHGDGGDWVLAVVVAVATITAASALAGLASLAVTGLYFTVVSLVVQVGIEKTIFSIGQLTGGAGGRGVSQPDLRGWFNTNRAVYLIAGVTCLLVTVAVWYVKQTRLVSLWVLTGHQPEGADAVGLRRPVHKVVVFALSGFLVGIAGCLAAFVNGTPPPIIQFGVIWSVILLAIPLASGMRTISAVWLVAACFAVIPNILQQHRMNPNLLSGGILLAALLSARAQVTVMARLRRSHTTWQIQQVMGSARSEARPPEHSLVDCPSMALVGKGIGVSFGGVRAVDLIDVRVGPGQRVAIMGSNGAGKTTLINALSGFVPLSQGTVTLGGTDITTMAPYARARLGLSRTFQLPKLAEVLTVRQNLETWHGYSPEMQERAEWLMEHFWISSVADVPVDMLSFGFRRRVELVRSLVCRPEVLLLDEPVGGLEDEEVARLIEVILDLQASEGWGLLLIEHNLDFVRGVADQLMVMQNGALVAEGPLAEVWDDERVRRIYLGETMPAQV
ncbi:MAG TPA: ATP-binding cassette domain-containing protein [Acidimicrobiia bacterium]|nr:ATP-binding cassette domain-containing protein [Acidimicrobiia bacterium]